MFWNNKDVKVDDWGHPVYLNKNNEWERLSTRVDLDDIYVCFKTLKKRIELLENHLNLEYIPETEKKEPAKLVGRKRDLGYGWNQADMLMRIKKYAEKAYETPKKKRGRPKKK